VLPITVASVRLFIHLIAATIWVGGQLTLAGLVPAMRKLDPSAPKAIARQFNRIAWPAFAVLVLSGVWNLLEVSFGDASTEYQVTVFVKLLIVALSGISAFLHAHARTRRGLALWGAASGVSTIAALFFGVLLRTSA
jgi:putative copper export protein